MLKAYRAQYGSSAMTFTLLPKKNRKPAEEATEWREDDEEALQEVLSSLRSYYSGDNVSQRCNKLASLKLFGSWDDEDLNPRNWEEDDVKAWRQFCQDMTCFDDEQTRNKSRLYEEAEHEIEEAKANQVDGVSIWPVAVVRNSMKMPEECPTTVKKKMKKQKRNQRKNLHVDVIFVHEDKYHCAREIEVLATPKNRIQDVFAGQSLAKF